MMRSGGDQHEWIFLQPVQMQGAGIDHIRDNAEFGSPLSHQPHDLDAGMFLDLHIESWMREQKTV
jgi:hypothetical protein